MEKTLTASFCASFSVSPSWHESLANDFWKECAPTPETIRDNEKYYYKGFVDFGMRQCNHYEHDFDNQPLTLVTKKGEIPFNLLSATLVVMPCNVLTFAFKVRCVNDDLNNITMLTSTLRTLCVSGSVLPQGLEVLDKILINPLRQVRRLTNCGADGPLVELGNKLRTFQIVENPEGDSLIDDECLADGLYPIDVTMFQVGCCSVVTNDVYSPLSMSPEYMHDNIERHRVKVYNNWRALALFDTFTILAAKVEPWQTGMWMEDYFKLIYLRSVFEKFCLQRLNAEFHDDQSCVSSLGERLNFFETHYCFNKVSFNFLPNKIAEAMDNALQVEEERRQLLAVIAQETARRQERVDNSTNNLLFFITLVSIVSAIYDAGCLFERFLNFGYSAAQSALIFRLSISLLFSVMVIVVSIFFYKKRQ